MTEYLHKFLETQKFFYSLLYFWTNKVKPKLEEKKEDKTNPAMMNAISKIFSDLKDLSNEIEYRLKSKEHSLVSYLTKINEFCCKFNKVDEIINHLILLNFFS
jgi:hypothetical protein